MNLFSLGQVIQKKKKRLTNVAIPLAKGNLPGLVSNLSSSAINRFERKISLKGAVRV